MNHNIYVYIFLMFLVTFFIRVLPLTVIRGEIKNKTIRSFLYYVPYVTLAVMTFPAVLKETAGIGSGLAAFAAGVLLAWHGKSLFTIAAASCAAVYILEFFFY